MKTQPALKKTTGRIATRAAAAALTVALASPAHADSTQYITLVLSASGTTQSATFSDLVGAVGTFTDDYVFASPPTLSALTFTGAAGNGISFTSVQLLTYGTSTSNPLTGSLGPTAFTEITSPSVGSAVYVLEIKGLSTSTTASYSGGITNAVPVPEPASWALWLFGLGATAGLARRSRNRVSARRSSTLRG